MKRVVIESPYAAGRGRTVAQHVAYAMLALEDCYEREEAPICSHLLGPLVLDDADPRQRTIGVRTGLEWARLADYAVFYTDLGWSAGMLAAKEFYVQNIIPYEERNLWTPYQIPEAFDAVAV